MANIFNEVEEDIRKERYQNLWKKFGKYLVGLLLSVVLIFSINQFLQSKSISDNKKLLELYFSAAESIEKNQFNIANQSLKKLYNDKNPTLAAFSGFKLSETYLKNGNKTEAITVLSNIFNNNLLERIYRDLALYKYIMINFDEMTVGEIEAKISLIDKSSRQLSPYFNELIGIKYITAGDKIKALSIFNELNSLDTTPFDLKVRLEKLIQIVG